MHGIVSVLRCWQGLKTEDFSQHHVYHAKCVNDGVWLLESPTPIARWRCPICGEVTYPVEWKPTGGQTL